MALWNVKPLNDEPNLSLADWRVFEVTYQDKDRVATRHLVGRDKYGGRVSSAVLTIDLTARRGKTGSGRVYELVGPPGFDSDAEYVWHAWERINLVESSRDVTAEVFPGRPGPARPHAPDNSAR